MPVAGVVLATPCEDRHSLLLGRDSGANSRNSIILESGDPIQFTDTYSLNVHSLYGGITRSDHHVVAGLAGIVVEISPGRSNPGGTYGTDTALSHRRAYAFIMHRNLRDLTASGR